MPPVLAHTDFSKQFTLDTDTSDSRLGGVLSQLGEDGKRENNCLWKPTVDQTRTPVLRQAARTSGSGKVCATVIARTSWASSLSWLQNFREPEGQLARVPVQGKGCGHITGEYIEQGDDEAGDNEAGFLKEE